jgi:ATP-dependent RNA helicase DHX37/DHR1
VENFPFPTPTTAAMEEADHCFKALQALDCTGKPTLLGKAMIRYPMSPRHSRFLLTVIQMMRKQNKKNHARPTVALGHAVATAAAAKLA